MVFIIRDWNPGIEAIADILGTELPGRGREEEEGEEEKRNIWEVSDQYY